MNNANNANNANNTNNMNDINGVSLWKGTHMNVSLLASTPNAKRVAFSAIRSCYSPGTARELFDSEFV